MTAQSPQQAALRLPYPVKVLGLAAVYMGAARIALQLAFVQGNVTPLWLPSGLSLAVLLLCGRRYWPGIALGAFATVLLAGDPLVYALFAALENTLEPLLGMVLLRRVVKFDEALERARDVLGLVVLAALLSTVAGATIGVAGLCLSGMLPWGAYLSAWWVWWVGNVLGILIVTPAILTWARCPMIRPTRRRVAEAALLFAGLLIVCLGLFGSKVFFESSVYLLVYMPLFIWIALRFHQREVATANLLLTLGAAWGTVHGFGPLSNPQPNESLALLSVFLGVIATTSLSLTAVIAEIRQTARALRQSEERFRAALEGGQDAFYILQSEYDRQRNLVDFSVVDLNQNGARLALSSRERMIGGRVRDLFPPYQLESFLDPFVRVARSRQALDMELTLSPDGRGPRWLHLLVVPLADGVAVTISDVTARRQAEEALRESEAKFRRFVEHSAEGIALADEQGNITEWNRSQEQISGLKREEVIGKPLWNVLAESGVDGELNKTSLLSFIQTGEAPWANKNREHELPCPDGSKRFVQVIAFAIRTDKGFLTANVSRDVTESRLAAEALRQSEASAHKQRLLAEALRDTVAVLTGSLDIEDVMHRILENVGRVVPHEGANIMLIEGGDVRVAYAWKMPPETDEFARSHRFTLDTSTLHEMLTTRAPLFIPDTQQFPGWVHGTVRSYVAAPLIVHGQVIGFLNLDSFQPGYFDATSAENLQVFAGQAAIAIENAQLYAASRRYAAELEKRVAERTAALTAANDKLTELDHLKSQFIADISHELRTPVAGMITSLYLLEKDRPDRRASHLISLKREAERLRDLLEDILDFSRLEETSRQPTHFLPVDLNLLIAPVIESSRPRADSAGLALHFTPAPDLPMVPGNADYLVRIVINLLTNAITYTTAGRVEVKTYLSERRNQVCVEVSDTGIGIAPEDLPHVFERFYRGRRVGSSNIPGAGLGLNIVKGIVDLHNGQVEVESEVDKGSTFRVWLPLT